MLELRHLVKSYEASEGAQATSVLKGIDLHIEAGETLAIVGPSGSGKSTLLNIMGTLDRPTSGQVLFEDRDLSQNDEKELARFRNQTIGFVFQMHHLLPQCSVLENTLIPTLASGKFTGSEAPQARAERLLKRVGLGDRLSHRPGQLSGGERQRVAVVRALINSPKLLLADEPTGALDRASAEKLASLLVELNKEEGVALVVITHSESLAAQMGTVYTLNDGRLEGGRKA